MFRDNLSTLIKKARSLSLRMGVPSIGWDDSLVIQTISFLYSSQRRGVFAVDLGAGIGYSTLQILRGLAKGCRGRCHVDAVEIKADRADVARSILGNLRGLGIDVSVVNMDAVRYLKEREDDSIDIAFVDVNKDVYTTILDLLSKRLKVGGVAMFHNAFFPKPPQIFFVKTSQPPWISFIIPTELGILIAIKG